MTFSTNLFPTVEKILLASLSKEDMEASLSAFYAVQIFQLAFVSLAMMAQVFVGNWLGEQKLSRIGPGIWQFIWFSLFSLVIIISSLYSQSSSSRSTSIHIHMTFCSPLL